LTPAAMKVIARFPAITRDISFFVSQKTPAAAVVKWVQSQQIDILEGVNILEEYTDSAKVPEGQKGMLWSITYRSLERTLTDKEVDSVHTKLVRGLIGAMNATQR